MDAPTRQQKIIIGTTAVGLHVLLITLLFFIIQIDEKKVIQIELEQEQKDLLAKAYDLPAALKPKKSNFGVPVVFKDIPSQNAQSPQVQKQMAQNNSKEKIKKETLRQAQDERTLKEKQDLKTILASIEKTKKDELEKQQETKKSFDKLRTNGLWNKNQALLRWTSKN